MRRRDFLKTLGAGTCAGLLGCAHGRERAGQQAPNIILCMADDQGWGDMAYNGHPVLQTPNFDAMAAAGLRFDQFHAAAPVCSPTRGSVMTGRHPNRFGCFQWGYTLRPQEITVAEALKSVGYVTGHFGKWHLGSVRKGSPVNPGASGFDTWLSAPNFFDNDAILSREGTAVETEGESSMVTVDAALEFIRDHAGDGPPFLAVVWFGSPHRPHRSTEEYLATYRDEPKTHRDFYGEIAGMDHAFGKLRAELRTLGIHEDTVLWYCSDNGGLPGQGVTGGREAKGSIYEGGLRVPAIVEWPRRIRKPAVTDIPCTTSDILPTLLDAAGARLPDSRPLDGISLMPLFAGERMPRRKPLGFWNYPIPGIITPSDQLLRELLEAQRAGHEPDDTTALRLDAGSVARQYPENAFPGHAAWLDWPWKLHRIEDKHGEVRMELYNLRKDSEEEIDLVALEPRRTARLQRDLEAWLVSVVRSLNGEDYAP